MISRYSSSNRSSDRKIRVKKLRVHVLTNIIVQNEKVKCRTEHIFLAIMLEIYNLPIKKKNSLKFYF